MKIVHPHIILNLFQDLISERLQDCFGGLFKLSRYFKSRNGLNAFTLAEVLITLGIIGVVAAITIPTLNKAVQNAQYKAAYKKAYAIASRAWQNVVTNNLDIYQVNGSVTTTSPNWLAFKSQFKIAKDCNNSDNHDCWDFNGEKYGPSANQPSSAKWAFIDDSGMSWSQVDSAIMQIMVDTNGLTAPNIMGKDRWTFLFITADNQYTGDLVKVRPGFIGSGDAFSSNTWTCPSPPCYYKSWLLN